MKIRPAALLAVSLLVSACAGSKEDLPSDTPHGASTVPGGYHDTIRTSDSTPIGIVSLDTGLSDPASRRPDTAGLPPAGLVSNRKYGFKSGIVEMASVTDKGRSATFYFDEYGEKTATHTTLRDSLNGQPLIIRQVNIMSDGWSTFYDANQKVGMKSQMLEGTMNYYPNFDSLTERQRRVYKYEPAPPRTILGRQAQGHSIEQRGMRANVWTWQGIPLRTESRSVRDKWIVFEATSVQTDVPIPADKFEVPSDVKIREMPKQ